MYRYSAFGNEFNPDANNNNPWRYGGEYWDWETQTYYLRARNYNPRTGRFSSPDPHWDIRTNAQFGDSPTMRNDRYMPSVHAILQSGNLFVFGINNPVMWADPSGLEIVLAGTDAEKREMLNIMRGLTNYDLAFDENGIVYITGGPTISSGRKNEGNRLIRALIDSTRIVTIQFGVDGVGSFAIGSCLGAFMVNGRPGTGTDATVFLDRSQATIDSPLKIILGHEMIHAHRFMTGTDVGFGVMSTIRINGQRVTVEAEELYVIGLRQPRRHRPITTENRLRRENNFAPRQLY